MSDLHHKSFYLETPSLRDPEVFSCYQFFAPHRRLRDDDIFLALLGTFPYHQRLLSFIMNFLSLTQQPLQS